jgi:hypothetical protein
MATRINELIIFVSGLWAEEETRCSGPSFETKTERWWGCKETAGWDPKD